jgi:hypothetical protein
MSTIIDKLNDEAFNDYQSRDAGNPQNPVLLVGVNLFGGSLGIHIPVNLITTGISGILGIPGIAALISVSAVNNFLKFLFQKFVSSSATYIRIPPLI